VVVDLPFGTYQADSKEALRSAIRIMKESGAHAVKLEGGSQIQESIQRILKAGIPVMGHLGLTPQSIYKFGTYSVRAKEEAEAQQLLNDAMMLEKAGCFAIVLEKIPAKLAEKFSPRFLRRYLDLNSDISKAVKAYTEDVKNQDFPKSEEQY
jgi:3-methyl-2-oxobutanoate hydroxymethyltransferase